MRDFWVEVKKKKKRKRKAGILLTRNALEIKTKNFFYGLWKGTNNHPRRIHDDVNWQFKRQCRKGFLWLSDVDDIFWCVVARNCWKRIIVWCQEGRVFCAFLFYGSLIPTVLHVLADPDSLAAVFASKRHWLLVLKVSRLVYHRPTLLTVVSIAFSDNLCDEGERCAQYCKSSANWRWEGLGLVWHWPTLYCSCC